MNISEGSNSRRQKVKHFIFDKVSLSQKPLERFESKDTALNLLHAKIKERNLSLTNRNIKNSLPNNKTSLYKSQSQKAFPFPMADSTVIYKISKMIKINKIKIKGNNALKKKENRGKSKSVCAIYPSSKRSFILSDNNRTSYSSRLSLQIHSPKLKLKSSSMPSTLSSDSPKKMTTTKLRQSLDSFYNNHNFYKFNRTPKRNDSYISIKSKVNTELEDCTSPKYEKGYITHKSMTTLEQESEALQQEIKHNIDKEEKFKNQNKITFKYKNYILEKKAEKLKQMYNDFAIEEKEGKNGKIEELRDFNSNCQYLKNLNSNVAYSQRYFLAKKIGFNWDDRYQYKKKDRIKLKAKNGIMVKPDNLLI